MDRHWKTITFVAALRQNGMRAPCTVDGPMNGSKFLAYVEQCLARTLKRRYIVVIDNLPAHKAAGIREAIEARDATLRYLPQYSPDLNPIEMPFSKLKVSLRKAAERTVPRLCRRIGKFACTLTARECVERAARHAVCRRGNGERNDPPHRGTGDSLGRQVDVAFSDSHKVRDCFGAHARRRATIVSAALPSSFFQHDHASTASSMEAVSPVSLVAFITNIGRI
jgi:transposase